jgi:hypothetical protein
MRFEIPDFQAFYSEPAGVFFVRLIMSEQTKIKGASAVKLLRPLLIEP